MTNTRLIILTCVLMALLIGLAAAVPTTGAVTINGPGKNTFTATGGSGNGWFEFGRAAGHPYWSTDNQTVSGAFSDVEENPLILCSKTYYVRACDDTGCGNEVSFTTAACVGLNATSYGSELKSIVKGGKLNLTDTPIRIFKPYTSQVGDTGMEFLIWALIFGAIFAWYWVKNGTVFCAAFLASIFGALFWSAGAFVGAMPEFMAIAQGALVAGIAGMIWSWWHN